MMKSFFKKLAFVMALAMVVTMAAPAAQAAKAAEVLDIVIQGTSTVVTESKLEKAGDTVDFAFKGAPKNWKDGFEWTSSNPAVATVNAAGVVTAVKNGTTIITLDILGTHIGQVKVTVGEVEETTNAFTVTQKSHNTFDVNFKKAVNYGRDNVYLYRVFETDKGDVYVVWAVRTATLSADKKTLTVQPYVDFADGDRYLVAFEDIEGQLNSGDALKGVDYFEFTTKIGEVTDVELNWYSTVNGAKSADKIAYTNGEDAEEDIEVTLDYKLFSDGVDLTEIYKNDGYVEFTMINEEQVADYVVLSDNVLVFTKENMPAIVKATYTFEDSLGEEKVATSDETVVRSQLLAPFAIAYVKEWSFTNDAEWSWDKPDHTLRAGKTGNVALLLVDNRGGQWETFGKVDNIIDFQESDSDTEDMYLKFYSTDNDHFLVDDDGNVETYVKTKKAVIYVALHDTALLEEGDDDFVRNIGACVMEIQDPSALTKAAIYAGNDVKTSATLVTNAIEDPANTTRFIEELTTADYTVKLLDQDSNVYNPDTDPVLTGTTVSFKMTTTNKELKADLEASNGESAQGLVLTDNGNGTATLAIDSTQLNNATNSSTLTITVSGTQFDEGGDEIKTVKTSFKIYLRDPELYDEDDETAGIIPAAWGIGTVKPTSWGLEVGNVGLMPADGKSTANIKITMLSKSYTVGYYNRYNMGEADAAGSDIYVIGNEKEYAFKKGVADTIIPGTGIYVLVTGPDGVVAQTTTPGALGVYVSNSANDYAIGVNVTGDSDGDDIVEYLATGKYTAKVTFVDKVTYVDGKVDTISYKTRTANFTVSNDLDVVKFVDMIEVETVNDVTDAEDFGAIETVVQENYKFQYDVANDGSMNDWVPGDAGEGEVYEVSCIVRGGYITIKAITFKMDAGNGKYYMTTTRNINRAVKLGVDE